MGLRRLPGLVDFVKKKNFMKGLPSIAHSDIQVRSIKSPYQSSKLLLSSTSSLLSIINAQAINAPSNKIDSKTLKTQVHIP